MRYAFIVFVVVALSTYKARADVKIVSTLDATNGIPAWNQSFKKRAQALINQNQYPANGYTECAETRELKNVYLCLSDTQKNMNLMTARAALFTEGSFGVPNGSVVSQSDERFQKAIKYIGGNDLKSTDLIDFYRNAQMACKQSPDTCLNNQESEIFSNLILPQARKTSDFVVITYALLSEMPYQDVVTHEIMHAQYFVQPKFRETVDNFWANSMSEDERSQVRQILGQYYDASNDYLMRNEFQAYMLQANAEEDFLKSLVPIFRERLMSAMKDADVDPVQIN
jgi:hypothetical protein